MAEQTQGLVDTVIVDVGRERWFFCKLCQKLIEGVAPDAKVVDDGLPLQVEVCIKVFVAYMVIDAVE